MRSHEYAAIKLTVKSGGKELLEGCKTCLKTTDQQPVPVLPSVDLPQGAEPQSRVPRTEAQGAVPAVLRGTEKSTRKSPLCRWSVTVISLMASHLASPLRFCWDLQSDLSTPEPARL